MITTCFLAASHGWSSYLSLTRAIKTFMIYLPIISLGFLILFLVGALISFQYFTHYQSLRLLERTHIVNQRERAQTALGFLVAFIFGAIIALGGLIFPAITGYKPTPFQISTLTPLPDSSGTITTNETPEVPPSQDDPTIEPSEPTTLATSTQILPTATIANTGGAGANIRSAAGLAGTIIATLPEGTRVILLNETQQVDGFNWQSIEMPDTRIGWVAVQFLSSDN
jgi:hypothetical protein